MSQRRRLLVLVAAVGLLLVPGAALAGHRFSDVDDSNTFHNDIGWLADNGITKGCNPPANTLFCPQSAVTRAQMGAFMRRLAASRAVDAGTLDGKDSSAFLGKTEKAADSAKLDGKDSSAFLGTTEKAADSAKLDGLDSGSLQSRGGAVNINGATVTGTATLIASITGFSVPTGGGAIIGSGDATFLGDSGPEVGLVWIEIDGSGACSGAVPIAAGWWQTFDFILSETASTSLTAAVNGGSHQIDFCAVGFDDTSIALNGSLTAQWVEVSQGGTTVSVAADVEMLAMLAKANAAAESAQPSGG